MTITITFDWMIPAPGITISLHAKQRGRGDPALSPFPSPRVPPPSGDITSILLPTGRV